MNQTEKAGHDLSGFYSYKDTFDEDSVWLEIPKHSMYYAPLLYSILYLMVSRETLSATLILRDLPLVRHAYNHILSPIQ